MVCSIHHEITTAPIARRICSFFAVLDNPFEDLNSSMMATKLAIEAAEINTNRKVRLESCSLAIFLTSSGCDENIIIQSSTIIVKAQPTHVTRARAGADVLWKLQTNMIALMHSDISKR